MITVSTLFSGSSGNSTLIRSENTAILIDAGRNCKAVCLSLESLGLSLSDISAIFITHEHTDHISALDVLSKKKQTPIHVTEPSAKEVCRKFAAAECAVIHRGLCFEEKIGDLTVQSFPLPHDSAAHVGYRIYSDDSDCAGVATDMGFPTMEAFDNLRYCRQIVIESNHDIEMLKRGPYPEHLKQRILSRYGHLSNEASAELCLGLAEAGCEKFMLAHLSAENNTPEKALTTVKEKLCNGGFADKVTVKIAPREYALTL